MIIVANNVAKAGQFNIPTAEQAAILKVLAYFDIFQYPLSRQEIRKYLGSLQSGDCFDETLDQLVNEGSVFLHKGFYSLHDNFLLAHRRREGNWRAEKLLPKALKAGRFLFRFPFVRGVCISGSLSKNFADDKADIDFFIITKANRLWIARTIMHLFKKLTFLTGHQHYFCMNYYIDDEALLINEQNIYTAVEIATLIPVAGKEINEKFFRVNNWVARFFPACYHADLEQDRSSNPWLKTLVERMLINRIANNLDRLLMKITTRRWAKKSRRGKRNKNGQAMKLLTGRHFSKSNPGSFQEKVLSLYEERLVELKINSF